ncbi:hypothetical protein CWR43_28010 [Rhizobium sullae]|uniref:Uncharacterized protein n=1 Tax=Rhizobium sullae TaxID=50338 RepID=A0A2N0D310_RHISU|nr:hypothetical protein [Rhizobium sullae]PKA40428.1 hypothetical protein CWR43_28010 [Rhizobium sullae]
MGCDIHCYAERRNGKKFAKVKCDAFGDRSYGTFGFLADVRNYSDVPPIAERRGFPNDASSGVLGSYQGWGSDAHSPSWLRVDELEAFDYDRPVEDRRVTRQTSWGLDGGCTAEAGGGKMTTYREFLGEWFFKDIAKLREAGADRIVFWFDN